MKFILASYFNNQLEDCILSPNPSSNVIPNVSQIGVSDMELLFWSPHHSQRAVGNSYVLV